MIQTTLFVGTQYVKKDMHYRFFGLYKGKYGLRRYVPMLLPKDEGVV